MGNDGGSIPKRRELVKEAARARTVGEMKATALESLAHAWAQCPLSSNPLDMDNAVSDWRGRLYNFESILKGLMPLAAEGGDDADEALEEEPTESGMTFASTGIKSVRDVVKLRFTKKVVDAKTAAGSETKKTIWVCPISMKEMGPATKAVYLVPCGHVFAEVAMREIGEDTTNCPDCNEEFKLDDVVTILPTEEAEVLRLAKRIERLRDAGLTHSLKKDKSAAKNNKKRKMGEVKPDAGHESKNGTDKKTDKVGGKLKGINHPIAALVAAKVLSGQDEKSKRRKLAAVAS